MTSQVLDQILELAPRTWPTRTYATIDLYAAGTTVLYTPPVDPMGQIGPIGGIGSPGGALFKPEYLDGGIERFRKPEWDSFHGEHMNYETVIPGIKKPITNIHIPMDDY